MLSLYQRHHRFHPCAPTAAYISGPTECALEDETYADGAETEVDCNRCVCSCGHWVCTAMTCDGEPYLGQKWGARAVTWVREGDMGMVGKEQGLEARGSPAAPPRSTVGGVRIPGASNERDW